MSVLGQTTRPFVRFRTFMAAGSRAEGAFDAWNRISRTFPRFHFSPTCVGFYMFVSHTVLTNHGGLREDFGAGYEEENDLVMRASKVGTRAVIANHAFAYHHAGSASFSLTSIDLASHLTDNLRRLRKPFIPSFFLSCADTSVPRTIEPSG